MTIEQVSSFLSLEKRPLSDRWELVQARFVPVDQANAHHSVRRDSKVYPSLVALGKASDPEDIVLHLRLSTLDDTPIDYVDSPSSVTQHTAELAYFCNSFAQKLPTDSLFLPFKASAQHGISVEDLARLLQSQDRSITVYLPSMRSETGPGPAKDLCDMLGKSQHRIRGVDSISALISVSFGWDTLLRSASFSDAECSRTLATLFGAVISGKPPAFGWHAGAICAVALLSHSKEWSEIERWQLGLIRDVAKRHCGDNQVIPWPNEDVLLWIQEQCLTQDVLAHLLQSVADANPSLVEQYIEEVAELVPVPQSLETEADTRLTGAIGRAWAAAGQYSKALEALEKAMLGWIHHKNMGSLSYPLCEYLRLQGILNSRTIVEKTIQDHVQSFNKSEPDAISAAFVKLAVGRALCQVGLWEEAAAQLSSESDWNAEVPEHGRSARLRWLRLACLHTGDISKADSALKDLTELSNSAQLHLAHIDECLLNGTDFRQHLRDLLEVPVDGSEARTLLRRLAPYLSLEEIAADKSLVQKLAWEYRY